MKKLFKILAIFLIIFFFIYKCHEEVKNVNKYIGFDLEYRRFILNKLYFSKNIYFNPKEIIWDKIRLPLRLEKEKTSWLDGKIAWEYHPDPLIFKAIAITYDLSDNDCIYSTENICSEELEESKKYIMKYYRKDQIIKYLRLYQDKYKSKPVLYHKFNHKLGRAKSQDALSMVYIMNNIRSTIWGDYYTDFDIENAHAVILSQILNGNYRCFYLDKYVKERDNTLNTLIKKHKIDRKIAKQIILAILYGQINTQVNDTLFEKLIKERNGNKKKKIKGWVNVLKEANPHIYEIAKELNKKEKWFIRFFKNINTTVGLILQEYEYRLFCAVFEWCEKEGLLTAPNVPELNGKLVFSYMFDGGCILTSAIDLWIKRTGKSIENLLEIFSEIGFIKTGILVRWVVKDWSNKIDINKYYMILKNISFS